LPSPIWLPTDGRHASFFHALVLKSGRLWCALRALIAKERMESPRKRLALVIGAFVFLMAAFGTQVLRLDIQFLEARDVDLRKAETTYMPPNEMVRVLSLGYEPLVSDFVFMSANNYFAGHLSFDRQYQWLHTYVDAIIGYCRGPDSTKLMLPPDECIAVDENNWIAGVFPFNPRVYLWASQVIKFSPLLTDDIIDRSIYYGKTGIHFCPDIWELYFDVGFNLYFEYRSKSPAEKKQLAEQGLDYLSIAALLPGSAVDPNFVSGTLWNKEENERAIQHLYLTYYHATDRQRKELRTRARFYGKQELADLFEASENRWKEQFRYLPANLFHVLGSLSKPAPQITGENNG
jgi:hypothetical protein